jgi:PTS system nitrogen regulatory IIA component
MQIVDLLTPARVVADLRSTSKKRLIEELARLLDADAAPERQRAVYEALIKRERLGSTGVGMGVAIPHGRSAAIARPSGAFVRLADPIDFNAVDGKPVDLVFALVVPEHFTDQHLMFLAQLAQMFSDSDVTRRLRDAPDSGALFKALASHYGETAAA